MSASRRRTAAARICTRVFSFSIVHSAGHDASRWTRSSAGRAGRGPASEHLCDTRALGGGGRRRAGAAGSREAPVSSREDRRVAPQSKRARLGFLSDIQHAAVAYTFVRNVLERSCAQRFGLLRLFVEVATGHVTQRMEGC